MSFGVRPSALQSSTKRMKEQRLLFELRRSYGKDRYYPLNGLAHALVLVAGRVCLGSEALLELTQAGFSIVVVLEGSPKPETEE